MEGRVYALLNFFVPEFSMPDTYCFQPISLTISMIMRNKETEAQIIELLWTTHSYLVPEPGLELSLEKWKLRSCSASKWNSSMNEKH